MRGGRCGCGGRMAPVKNRRDERTGEVWNVFECQNAECGRVVERRSRRCPLYLAGQPTMAIAIGMADRKDRTR